MSGRLPPPLGLGLVGCGRFGTFCLAAAADLPSIIAVAVTDVDPDRAAGLAAAHGARAVPDLDALLADPEVEVVIIATPPVAHGPMARAAAEAGKHVFCEKPLAIDLIAASAAVEASERLQRRLTVDYVMRWNPLYWLVRRLQELRRADGTALLGPLQRFALENLAADEPAGSWFWDRGVSGGIFVEHGVHFFDAAAWLFGSQPLIVQALEVERDANPVDTVIASAVHPGGGTASYYHAFTHPDRAQYQAVLLDWGFAHGLLRGWIPVELELEVWTDAEGAALLDAQLADSAEALAVPHVRPSGREAIDLRVTDVAEAGLWSGRGEERQVTHRLRVWATLGGQDAKLLVYRESVRAGIADLVEAVRSGRSPAVGITDVYESLATAIAAQEAADAGRTREPEHLQLRSFA
ncbi:MAG: Gfo/Idh/MocA family oxidoreductase [Chloroflexota bacterium]|nr:Gfo/Idh/MocA family oxidoreductase [Chloroflexota bacterium]